MEGGVSPYYLKDVEALRLELQQKEEENTALQAAFDDYVESSKELEEELETELEKAEARISDLLTEKARLEERCSETLEKSERTSLSLGRAETELNQLRAHHASLKEQKWRLEQRNDEIEEQLRIAEASHENVKHTLERAIEENVFLTSDLEELRRTSTAVEQRLRTEMALLATELSAVKANLIALQSHSQEGQNSTQATGEETANRVEFVSQEVANGTTPRTSDQSSVVGESEVEYLRERVIDLEMRNEELIAELTGESPASSQRLHSELIAMQEQKQNLEHTIEELTTALETHMTQSRVLEEQNQASREKYELSILKLETDLAKERDSSAELKTQLQDAAAELEEKKSLLTSAQNRVSQLNARLEQEASRQGELRAQINELQEHLEQETARVASLEVSLSQAKDDQERARAVEGSSEDALEKAQLAGEKHRLEQRVKELEEKLHDLKKRRSARGVSLGGTGGVLSPYGIMSPSTNNPMSPQQFLRSSLDFGAGSPLQEASPVSSPPRKKSLEEMQSSHKSDFYQDAPLEQTCNVSISYTDRANQEQSLLDSSIMLQEKFKFLQDNYEEQRLENAKLLRQIQQIKGNIQVCCRIRPSTSEEKKSGSKMVLDCLGEGEVGFWDRRQERWSSYTFDRVWGWDMAQEKVYRDVAPVTMAVVDGFNACVFAYGQTGSGKTHTMIGPADDPGVSARTVRQIFELLELKSSAYSQETGLGALEMINHSSQSETAVPEISNSFEWSVRVAMMEIYNEEIRDLLAPPSNNPTSSFGHGGDKAKEGGSLQIRINAEGQSEIPGLTFVQASCAQEVMEVFEKGNSSRATASTDLNAHSSRSHSVFTIEVTTNENDGLPKIGRLHLVDLAGSERVKQSNVTGKELKEAQHINRSLAALGDVMESLDQKASHVPYRNSKLTYFLQDSIGGSSLTLMIVTLCPTDTTYEETHHGLEFAWRVRHIQRQPVQRNVQTKNLQEKLKQARAEILKITKKKEHAEEALALSKREYTAVSAKMSTMMENRLQNNNDMVKARDKRIEEMKLQNTNLSKRLETEKAVREKLQAESEELTRQAKRFESMVKNQQKEMQLLQVQVAEKDAELTVLKREVRVVQVNQRVAAAQQRGNSSALRARQSMGGATGSQMRQRVQREAELSRRNSLKNVLPGDSAGPAKAPSETSRRSKGSVYSGRSTSLLDMPESRTRESSRNSEHQGHGGFGIAYKVDQRSSSTRRSVTPTSIRAAPSHSSPVPGRRDSTSSRRDSISSQSPSGRSTKPSQPSSASKRHDINTGKSVLDQFLGNSDSDSMTRADVALQKHKSRMLAKLQAANSP